MKLIPNAKDVLKKAWSVRFLFLAVLFAILEAAFPYFEGILPVSQGTFGALSGLFSGAALIARHIYQENLPDG